MLKKKVLFVVLAGVIFLALNTSMVSAKKVTLRVMLTSWVSSKADDSINKGAWEAGIKEFEKRRPDVKVVEDIVPWDKMYAKVIIASEAGNPPDLFITGDIYMPETISGGYLQPLDEWMPQEKIDDIIPRLNNLLSDKGKQYAVPLNTDCRLLFYRKDLFSQAGLDPEKSPQTWDELVAYGQKLTDASKDVWGYGWFGHRDIQTSFCTWWPAIWSCNGKVIDDEGKAAFNTPETLRGWGFLKDTVEKYKISPEAAFTVDHEGVRRGFQAGRYAIAIQGSWTYWGEGRQSHAEKFGDNLGWGPIPKPADGEFATTSGIWVYCMSNKTKIPEIAWDYIDSMTSFEPLWITLAIQVPTYKSLLNSPDLGTVDGPYYKAIAEFTAKYTRTTPKTRAQFALFEVMQEVGQKVMLSDEDPMKLLNEAVNKYNTEYWKPME